MPTAELQTIVDADTVARVLLQGDLQKLTSAQKVSYYNAVCQSVGLNPLTQPFQYLVLNGREVLYARREATEQLRQLHQVSIQIVGRELVDGIYVVTARATLPSGRTDENIGAVPLEGLKGDNRANAMMKAETKAKRRVTLAICGLGMLDELEVADIPRSALVAPAPSAVPLAADAEAFTPSSPERGEIRDATPPPMPDYATSVPPIDTPWPDPADGALRILRIDSAPTRNKNITKYRLQLSDDRTVVTIDPWVASLAVNYKDNRTPVRIKTKPAKIGSEIDVDELMTGDETKTPPKPREFTSNDIPF